MPDQNIGDTRTSPDEHQPKPGKKPLGNMAIVAWNLLALVIYTLLSATVGGGIVIDALFLFIHVFICLIVALANRNWFWLLSGILVLIVGFSTCALLANFTGLK